MSNPTMEHLTIDDITYDIVDSTSGYITDNVISALRSTVTPSALAMSASVGTSNMLARADHRHKFGEKIVASDSSYQLALQPDANFVMTNLSDDSIVWQTGAEGRRQPVIYMKTVSGSTNTNGNISLALAPGTYTVWSVVRTDDNNTACVPFQGGSNWYARCLQANTANHAVRASTSVTLRVVYSNTKALIDALSS